MIRVYGLSLHFGFLFGSMDIYLENAKVYFREWNFDELGNKGLAQRWVYFQVNQLQKFFNFWVNVQSISPKSLQQFTQPASLSKLYE